MRDEVGQTPLHKAVLSGEENVIEALIHGADPDITDSVGHGHTALAWFFDNPLNARCLYALELLLQVSGGSRISPRWECQLFGGGRQHTILPNFPKKLHEIERIWTEGGSYLAFPLRSATACEQCYKQSYMKLYFTTQFVTLQLVLMVGSIYE